MIATYVNIGLSINVVKPLNAKQGDKLPVVAVSAFQNAVMHSSKCDPVDIRGWLSNVS